MEIYNRNYKITSTRVLAAALVILRGPLHSKYQNRLKCPILTRVTHRHYRKSGKERLKDESSDHCRKLIPGTVQTWIGAIVRSRHEQRRPEQLSGRLGNSVLYEGRSVMMMTLSEFDLEAMVLTAKDRRRAKADLVWHNAKMSQ